MIELLEQVQVFLQNSNFQWAVCGGYALDLFLNCQTRKHGDIDICVFERDRECITEFMLSKDWRVFQFLGQGKVRPLSGGDASDPGRNLMCIKEGCRLVQFYPCEEKDVLLHAFFHTGIERLDYLEFLFNDIQDNQFVFSREVSLMRDIHKAILYNNGIPSIAPEIALLFKASETDNPEYQRDYALTLPHLGEEQLHWLHDGLRKRYPQGHPWIREQDIL